jgi:uncharacterized protein
MNPAKPLQAPIVSCFQALALTEANRRGERRLQLSLDLGCSVVEVSLDALGVQLTPESSLSWDDLAYVAKHQNLCFEVHAHELVPIRAFSEEFGRTYQLMPTEHEPALLIAGFVMHRFRDVTPMQGAEAMVKAVVPFHGRLLDTATGLGYAAIEAARYASEVLTIELDPIANEMASRNPMSRPLFTDPKITRLIGNSAQVIRTMPALHFAALVHDPPAINLAGELYSAEFYAEALRVLQRGGKMFHYVGDPQSASGARTTKGVVRRLQEVGFKKVIPKPLAFGVLALK